MDWKIVVIKVFTDVKIVVAVVWMEVTALWKVVEIPVQIPPKNVLMLFSVLVKNVCRFIQIFEKKVFTEVQRDDHDVPNQPRKTFVIFFIVLKMFEILFQTPVKMEETIPFTHQECQE